MRTGLKLLALICLASLASGCQMLPKKSTETPQVEDLTLESPQKQNQQVKTAISLLEQGEKLKAIELIQQVLYYNPKHPTASLLEKQLNQSAETLFNTQRFINYQVETGDTLGGIAEDWLGDPIYFVSLAKLNQIDQPTNLQPGSSIKIPVTGASELVKKERRRSTANLRLLRQYRNDRQYKKGLEKSNRLFFVESDREQVLQMQNLLLADYAKASVSLSEREIMLAQVAVIADSATRVQQQVNYQHFINRHKNRLFLDQAALLYEDKSYPEAARKFIAADKIEGNYERSQSDRIIEQQLVDRLHEQAVVLYRNQELEQALDRWSLILQIEPDNELAQKYAQRTNKLLSKLNQY